MKHSVIVILGVTTVLLLNACASAPSRRLTDAVTLRRQAMTAYQRGDLANALKDYRALAELLPSDTRVWFHLGNVYARLNQPRQAVDAYRHVLQRDPMHAKAWHNLGVVYMHQSEAAFVQSANAARHDPDLRRKGMAMAQRIAGLARSPLAQDDPEPADTTSTPGVPVPAPASSSLPRPDPDEGPGS